MGKERERNETERLTHIREICETPVSLGRLDDGGRALLPIKTLIHY